ncbi:unnamed protein product [Caenorhabditis brenneri]
MEPPPSSLHPWRTTPRDRGRTRRIRSLLRSRYPRPAEPVTANTAQHQPPPPAGSSSIASSDPHDIPTIVYVEERHGSAEINASSHRPHYQH